MRGQTTVVPLRRRSFSVSSFVRVTEEGNLLNLSLDDWISRTDINEYHSRSNFSATPSNDITTSVELWLMINFKIINDFEL